MTEQRKNLRKYILPAMIGNLSFFVLTIVDGMFVGNGVGPDALGAVSLAMPFVNLIWALSTLFNIGGVAVASVRLGRGDTEGANLAFMHALSANIAVFSIISVTGMLLRGKIARLLGANETYLQMVSDYIFWYSVFLIPSTLGPCLNTFARNDGNPKLGLIMSLCCSAANIFGDWLMVYPLQKGIASAAIATGVSGPIGFFHRIVPFYSEKRKAQDPALPAAGVSISEGHASRTAGNDLTVCKPDHFLFHEPHAHYPPRQCGAQRLLRDCLCKLAILVSDVGRCKRFAAAVWCKLRREG